MPYGDVRDERASLDEDEVLGREARLFPALFDSLTPNRSSIIMLAEMSTHQRSRIVARIPV